MRRNRGCSLILLLACLAAVARDGAAASSAGSDAQRRIPAAVASAAKLITREALEAPIRFLADDLLEGRRPATRGDSLTRLYLSTQLQELGYLPGGPGGRWDQPFDIVRVASTAPGTWSFNADDKRINLALSKDYVVTAGEQSPEISVTDAQLVFVGYGIEAPEYRWNDFKDVDVTGRILVMLNNDPDWDETLFAGKRRLYYGRWTYKYEVAARHGAAGAIIIHTTPSAGYPWQVLQTSWTGEQYELPAEHEPHMQLKAWMTEQAVRRLLAASGHDLDALVASARSRNFRPVTLGIRTSLRFKATLARTQSANVLGLLPGSDPKLAAEVVIYSAHHDHLGIAAPDANGAKAQADRIYNGAVDNAAGCAQLLAIARAMAGLPQRPKRSILMIFAAAEEQGLLGSLYYSRHPTFPPGKIAADFNYDGGNIWGATRDVPVVGYGRSTLDGMLTAAAAFQNRLVTPEQDQDRGYFYRSDEFSFATIGAPAIALNTGTDFIGRPPGWGQQQKDQWDEVRYHQPSDELDSSWNFDGMIQNAQLGYYAGWLVAQSAELPQWNRGDEFEDERLRAVAAQGSRTQ